MPKKFMKKCAGSFVLLLLLAMPGWAFSQSVSLTILHTNDTHGHLLPFSYPDSVTSGSEYAELSARKNIGGIARRATLVKRLRAELGMRGATVWLVDAGDYSEGTPFSLEYYGEADIAAMNAAQYDFGTLGNHEFNNSLERLKKLLTLFRFPVLCANAFETTSGRPLVQPYQIRELRPLKIGLFGLLTRSTAGYPAARQGVRIEDEVKTAREMAAMLNQKADIVIALSHSGEKVDRRIAAEVPGIDVIIGGHSHSRLPSGDRVWRSEEVRPDGANRTILVQAHQWGGELGRLDLLFDKDARGTWHVDEFRARLIPVTADIPDDPEVAAVVARYWKPIAARYEEVLGEASADFIVRGNDLAPYNLVADLVRETYQTDIGLENIGGVRSDLLKGRITIADLANLDPFDNTVITFRISGSRLKEILLKERPAVSGIRYRIENGKLVRATVGGRTIQNQRIYTGATNSYLARTALKGIETKDTERQRRDVIIEAVRRKKTVKPLYDGRRIIRQTTEYTN